MIDEFSRQPAGTEQQLVRLVRGLVKHRLIVHVIATRRSDWTGEIAPGVTVDYLDAQSLRKGGLIHGIRKLQALAERYELDVVHSIYFDSIVISSLAGLRRRGVSHVTTRRGFLNSERPNRARLVLLKTLRNRCDACVCNSNALAQYVHSSEGIPRERIRVIYNGLRLVDEPRRNEVPAVLTMRISEIAGGGPVVCTVANLRVVKNLDFLQRAAKAVISWNPAVQFVVVGEGEERTLLEMNARRMGIDRNFHLLGGLPEPWPVLEVAAMVVQTSKSESLSNAIIEGSAAGLPVIASDVGGNPEAIDSDVTGFLYSADDLEQLVSRIKLLTENRKLGREMGEAGKRFVEEKFAGIRYVEEHLRLYQELAV